MVLDWWYSASVGNRGVHFSYEHTAFHTMIHVQAHVSIQRHLPEPKHISCYIYTLVHIHDNTSSYTHIVISAYVTHTHTGVFTQTDRNQAVDTTYTQWTHMYRQHCPHTLVIAQVLRGRKLTITFSSFQTTNLFTLIPENIAKTLTSRITTQNSWKTLSPWWKRWPQTPNNVSITGAKLDREFLVIFQGQRGGLWFW